MDKIIRDSIYSPLVAGNLGVLIPDLTVELPGNTINGPAHLSGGSGEFEIALHLKQNRDEAKLLMLKKRVFSEDDQWMIGGRIGGVIPFRAKVFPSCEASSRGYGSLTVIFNTSRLELVAEGLDILSTGEILDILGEKKETNPLSFEAHLIFRGPKLKLKNAGTDIVSKNDYLGELTKSTTDTYLFSGENWEAALIQKDDELHLHVRSKKDSPEGIREPKDLVDRVAWAAAFVGGFQPWPVYRELRVDYKIKERWIAHKLNLGQSFLAPVSEWLGRHAPGDEKDGIITRIAEGLGKIPPESRENLLHLLRHNLTSDLSDLPPSTKLLLACAGLDGLLKLISGHEHDPKKRTQAKQIWMKAFETIHLSWKPWGDELFALWEKYRNDLAHGWLWLPHTEAPEIYFEDYPKLGCAFSIIVSAWCGYEGEVVSQPLAGETVRIAELKMEADSEKK